MSLELPSLDKEEDECDNDFERWIYVLKNMETLNRLPFKARKSVFEKLEKIVDIASLSRDEREKYDESIKVYRDHLATITYAQEKGWAKGMEQGMAKGIAKGRAEGMAKGMEQGRLAEKLVIAQSLMSQNVPLDIISQCTGLTIEEITHLGK